MDRERERVGVRSDAASLWIDFVLLPAKLEEHLAAGPSAVPSPPELVCLFLEQAFPTQRVPNSASSGNVANKESESHTSGKVPSKTASVLCERAARVAVVAEFSLSKIEGLLASPQHQFMLLKTLIRHDEGRSLLHQCNLHRWLLRRAIQCHPVGSAAPNSTFPSARTALSTFGDDLAEILSSSNSGNLGTNSTEGTSENSVEDERVSISFLEQVLRDEDGGNPVRVEQDRGSDNDACSSFRSKATMSQGCVNGCSKKEQVLSTVYICQIMFDVAEVHFMRGRIREAQTLFDRCRQSLSLLTTNTKASESECDGEVNVRYRLCPVPQYRLTGFIVACRMLLSSHLENNSRALTDWNTVMSDVSQPHGSLSSAQLAVIACERSRLSCKGCVRSSSLERYPTDDVKRKRISKQVSLDSVGDGGGCVDQTVSENPSKRAKHAGNDRGVQEKEYIVGENGHAFEPSVELPCNTQPSFSKVDDTNDTVALADGKIVVNGIVSHKYQVKALSGQCAVTRENGVSLQNMINLHEKSEGLDNVPSNNVVGDLDSHVKDDQKLTEGIYQIEEVSNVYDTRSQHDHLAQEFIDDILRHHLPWAYCVSVENDHRLSQLDRLRVAACNVVRSVLGGEPVEAFLRVSDQFEDNNEGVEFLMQLLHSIKVKKKGDESSTEEIPSGGNQKERTVQPRIIRENSGAKSVVVHRVHDLAVYVCCVIDDPWCWDFAVECRLVDKTDLPRFGSSYIDDYIKPTESSATSGHPGPALENSIEADAIVEDLYPSSGSDHVMSLLQLESLTDVEFVVQQCWDFEAADLRSRVVCTDLERRLPDDRKQEVASSAGVDGNVVSHQATQLPSSNQNGMKVSSPVSSDDQLCVWATGSVQCGLVEKKMVSSVLKGRAFTVLKVAKDVLMAKAMYESILRINKDDVDSIMMLWLFERIADAEEATKGRSDSSWSRYLPKDLGGCVSPGPVLVEFAVLYLVEKELWNLISELCTWALSFFKDLMSANTSSYGGVSVGSSSSETIRTREDSKLSVVLEPGEAKDQRRMQILKLGVILSELLPLCASLQAAASQNHFNEDVARLGSTLSKLFEDFMCVTTGVEIDGNKGGSEDSSSNGSLNYSRSQFRVATNLISSISNPKVLMWLASLTAGWLQRCHVAGLSTWSLAVERYGLLAGVTAGATLPPPPGPLAYASSVLRPVPPRVAPEYGRSLFGRLLETIVRSPGVVEIDGEKGHRWLQGLADLAFEEEAHVNALRLFLRAGAISSAQYCDRVNLMSSWQNIFTPWVVQRMIASCRAIGAVVQAAVLCQCTPVPEHELAFRIVQENCLIVDADAASYFECIWEVPILELLVHLHSKAGDEERVNFLIGLLQQPTLNVHNPSAIRQAHISAMEQRFLQRFASELLE